MWQLSGLLCAVPAALTTIFNKPGTKGLDADPATTTTGLIARGIATFGSAFTPAGTLIIIL